MIRNRSQAHYHFTFGYLFFTLICYQSITSNDINNNNQCVTLIEINNDIHGFVPVDKNVTISCKTNCTYNTQWWLYNNENITNDTRFTQSFQALSGSGIVFSTFYLHISNINFNQSGIYTCHILVNNDGDVNIDDNVAEVEKSIQLNVTIPLQITNYSKTVRTKYRDKVILYCLIEGYPLNNIRWLKDNSDQSKALLLKNTVVTSVSETVTNISLKLIDLSKKDNGTYSCHATDINGRNVSENIALLILDKPQVRIETAKALGTNTIYLNWTVNDGNDRENIKYTIQYMVDGTSSWYYYPVEINGAVVSAVLENNVFKNNTGYSLRMEARNSEGAGQKSNIVKVNTLDVNPEFIPDVKVTGFTVSSITISWSLLPPDLNGLIHYYQLKLWSFNSTTATEAIHSTPNDNLYMFRDLIPATTYEFQVAACSEYTRKCCPWSPVINATTLDGISEPPENVTLDCRFDNISHTSFVFVTWELPKVSNGKIMHYNIMLEGDAMFVNDKGNIENVTWGPKMTSVSDKYFSTRFYNISANTNYTVKISAVTRMKKHGKHMVLRCTMPPTIPDKSKLSQYSWNKVEEQNKWMFRLYLPRISERNGAVCCYRIYIIRMESNKGLAELPSPEDMHIGSYQEAHRTPKGGAYVAEMFSSEYYQSEIFLGDEQVLNYTNSPCVYCTGISSHAYRGALSPTTTTSNPTVVSTSFTTTTITTTIDNMLTTKIDPFELKLSRLKRYVPQQSVDYELPYDGILDINSNYTGFVEIVVYGSSKGETLTAYSNYFSIMNPGPEVLEAPQTQVLGIIIQILCILILIILILLMALCVLHRYTKQVAHVQGIEMITFRNSFRHLCRSFRGRHRLVSLSPPDMNPISKSDLINVYTERHRDSDYGFQREFELLPDRFSDRTTRASEARENIYKNRYPDIKAYDQTRVKLAQIDSIAGSDYINANFVIGYKERKKFICAQGPMENTVCDFWRMIWEQHLELILMLTNLEEYSKTKCAKYWPDKAEGEKIFGDITVSHLEEKRCSDYMVRQLHVSKSNGNNKNKDERILTQYHYLVWKDFMAPEHPYGVMKFIKRINELYSLEKGSILVHCSAGVGRTGTLVALDSLLQQLSEEGQIAIFNTVCDLRHQRNFLVQSLKQYIFIYRVLMEMIQYGDTEIHASELKIAVDKLKRNDSGKSKMEEDYEKIKCAVEDRKSITVGGGDENHHKNRSEFVIPYDRNRVILTPILGKEHSTYINASFIEGYDNSESFIITQDPLETTIADFWRMISEQGICIIVMLSNLGDSAKKCPRYWPDDEITYDHIFIKYIQSESCPYYTRREFIVTNNKSDENVMVTQLQYHGWPTVEGEVPEVTRGLIELIDQIRNVQEQQNFNGPTVIHCNYGSDRSSMFVGLSILVQQLRTERRVDVFNTTRKLRSQRQGMISTFAQYEFLHRAILNYADLHQLYDES